MPPAKSIYAANCHLRWALRVYLTAQYTHSHIHAHTHTRTHTSTSKHTSTSTLNHKHVTARPHARLQHSIVISPYGHSTARGSAARHGIAPHCTVPHCTTPHHTALYHTTPHHTTPHHTAPHHPSISSPHLAPYRVSRHLLPCCLRRPSNGSTRRLKMSHSSAAAALLISYGTRRSRCLLCECCVSAVLLNLTSHLSLSRHTPQQPTGTRFISSHLIPLHATLPYLIPLYAATLHTIWPCYSWVAVKGQSPVSEATWEEGNVRSMAALASVQVEEDTGEESKQGAEAGIAAGADAVDTAAVISAGSSVGEAEGGSIDGGSGSRKRRADDANGEGVDEVPSTPPHPSPACPIPFLLIRPHSVHPRPVPPCPFSTHPAPSIASHRTTSYPIPSYRRGSHVKCALHVVLSHAVPPHPTRCFPFVSHLTHFALSDHVSCHTSPWLSRHAHFFSFTVAGRPRCGDIAAA